MYDIININYLELVQHGCRLSDVVRDQNSRTNLLRHKRYNNGRNAECQSGYDERRKDNERSLNDDVDDSDNYYKIIVYTPPRHRYLFAAGCNLFELTIYIFTLH